MIHFEKTEDDVRREAQIKPPFHRTTKWAIILAALLFVFIFIKAIVDLQDNVVM